MATDITNSAHSPELLILDCSGNLLSFADEENCGASTAANDRARLGIGMYRNNPPSLQSSSCCEESDDEVGLPSPSTLPPPNNDFGMEGGCNADSSKSSAESSSSTSQMTDDDGSIKSSIAELPPIFEVVARKKKRERPIEDDTMMGGADMEDDLSEKAYQAIERVWPLFHTPSVIQVHIGNLNKSVTSDDLLNLTFNYAIGSVLVSWPNERHNYVRSSPS